MVVRAFSVYQFSCHSRSLAGRPAAVWRHIRTLHTMSPLDYIFTFTFGAFPHATTTVYKKLPTAERGGVIDGQTEEELAWLWLTCDVG